MNNFFENMNFPYPEKAVLMEDIILPESYDEYENVVGKFSIPIFMPLLDKGEVKDKVQAKPSSKGQLGNTLDMSSYTSANYVKMVIPRYILLNFKNIVPKDTTFIMCSIGASLNVKKFQIIGIFNEVNYND